MHDMDACSQMDDHLRAFDREIPFLVIRPIVQPGPLDGRPAVNVVIKAMAFNSNRGPHEPAGFRQTAAERGANKPVRTSDQDAIRHCYLCHTRRFT